MRNFTTASQDGGVVDQLSGVVDKADMAAKLHALTESSQA